MNQKNKKDANKQIDQKIRLALCREVECIQEDPERIERTRCLVYQKIKERNAMKRWSAKKVIVTAAAICVLGSITAVAAGKVVSSIASSNRNEAFYNYHDIENMEKKLGYEIKVPETFTNGYSFKEGVPVHDQGRDEAGNVVKASESVSLDYIKEGKADIFISVEGCRLYEEQSEAEQTSQYGNITLSYHCDKYRFVPVDYQVSDEEQQLMDAGKLFVSYGSEQVENKEAKGVTWEDNGVYYYIGSFNNDMMPDEFFQMAQEMIKTE